MKTLREFICYNQKQIIKFEYTISQYHRDLKDLIREKNPDEGKLQEAYDRLAVDSFLLMESIFKENNEFILNNFGLKDKNLRFTIKMVYGENVLDIFRNHDTDTILNETLYSENTAFDNIMNDGAKYYLNNDIEQSYNNNEYKNPRLKENESWENAWENYSNADASDKYYNSTLVIPMSITSKNLDEKSLFYKKYFEQRSKGKVNTNTRAIWGFVCFDTKKKNYFDENLDLDLGFIIADILSLYVIFYYNYAISSQTVLKYEEIYF